MYEKLLSMTWNDMINSDYLLKSNTAKYVVQIYGNEFVDGDDSLILIYYNMFTKTPMLMLQRWNRHDVGVNPPEVEGYNITVVEDVETDGTEFTEVTYVLSELQKALQE
jgi:hypothetical protein